MKSLCGLVLVLALATTAGAATSTSDQNKSIAISAMEGIFKTKAADTVDRYFAEPYVQHNLRIPDGLASLRTLAVRAAEDPQVNTTIYRAISDGDMVALHSVYDGLARFDHKPMVAFDLFRIKDGKIVEHWDALMPLVGSAAGDRPQAAGPSDVGDKAHTEASRALVSDFVRTVRIPGAQEAWDRFVDRAYQEHALAPIRGAAAPKLVKLHRVIAEGDLVLTQSEGVSDGRPGAVYDLYRVSNGRIVEHWEVMDIFIPRAQWQHANGPF